jgi:hypothetical protein
LRELNAFYGDVGLATGFLGSENERAGSPVGRNMLNLFATPAIGLQIGNPSNPYKRVTALRAQRAAMR